jgi:hypothetical protein
LLDEPFDFKVLLAQQQPNCPSMNPSAPILPEQWPKTNRQWMQQDADLARLLGGTALPLALGAPWTRTATVEASPVHNPQAAIDFCAAFMRDQRLVSRTAQGPIWPEREVLSGETTGFPGQAYLRGRIACGRCRVGWRR